jgi:hypothetical protein
VPIGFESQPVGAGATQFLSVAQIKTAVPYCAT